MKCLRKYDWVKLCRMHLPPGKGIMGQWARLASKAAFRKGKAFYCGYHNEVMPGTWVGGIVGLKSILNAKSRAEALGIMDKLVALGYICYELDDKSKKLTYCIKDWVIECSGKECMNGVVYTTDGYGFLCLPRDITQRLVKQEYIFDEADAWLDLWCHTAYEDPDNAFSFLAPTVQYGKMGAVLTLETLGRRWRWEKTKVWRFFNKHRDAFTLHRLPGAYGCLIFNRLFPRGKAGEIPTEKEIASILEELRGASGWTERYGTDNEHINRMVAYKSRKLTESESRVALSTDIIKYAYLSPCWDCKNCNKDCLSININPAVAKTNEIRGPCNTTDEINFGGIYYGY